MFTELSIHTDCLIISNERPETLTHDWTFNLQFDLNFLKWYLDLCFLCFIPISVSTRTPICLYRGSYYPPKSYPVLWHVNLIMPLSHRFFMTFRKKTQLDIELCEHITLYTESKLTLYIPELTYTCHRLQHMYFVRRAYYSHF